MSFAMTFSILLLADFYHFPHDIHNQIMSKRFVCNGTDKSYNIFSIEKSKVLPTRDLLIQYNTQYIVSCIHCANVYLSISKQRRK
jgi:hypothetical protein